MCALLRDVGHLWSALFHSKREKFEVLTLRLLCEESALRRERDEFRILMDLSSSISLSCPVDKHGRISVIPLKERHLPRRHPHGLKDLAQVVHAHRPIYIGLRTGALRCTQGEVH